ncbi:hypothetical protein BRAO375_240005 [Bradyrhizobium sp. ORS 375]|uniref:HipA family kinase n=1 Tax=Bradyrhizobium sp. (strain ORS 375) TaxID=566679 RepID=UPI0002406EC8|nr:hypothetical protein BRAO375_240005 [Bradyrhizobium sp. ORS 375]
MIRRGTAIGFSRQAAPGRTEPLRVTVLTDDGAEYEAVMKISTGMELGSEALMNEMLGSLLAADLGLPVQEPFFVELSAEFCASIPIPAIRARLATSCSLAFACLDAGKQWRGWNATDRISSAQEALAVSIMAFDGFTGNSDRRPGNPNLLVRDQEWRLIDHENSFSYRLRLFPRCQPWIVGNLAGMITSGAPSEHIFASQLIGRETLSLAPIKDSWLALSDARLAQYDAILPAEWDDTRPYLLEALEHIRRVRDTIDPCLTELERILS